MQNTKNFSKNLFIKRTIIEIISTIRFITIHNLILWIQE